MIFFFKWYTFFSIFLTISNVKHVIIIFFFFKISFVICDYDLFIVNKFLSELIGHFFSFFFLLFENFISNLSAHMYIIMKKVFLFSTMHVWIRWELGSSDKVTWTLTETFSGSSLHVTSSDSSRFHLPHSHHRHHHHRGDVPIVIYNDGGQQEMAEVSDWCNESFALENSQDPGSLQNQA